MQSAAALGGKDAQNPRATTYLSRQLHRRRKAVSNCVPCIGKSTQELSRRAPAWPHVRIGMAHPKPS